MVKYSSTWTIIKGTNLIWLPVITRADSCTSRSLLISCRGYVWWNYAEYGKAWSILIGYPGHGIWNHFIFPIVIVLEHNLGYPYRGEDRVYFWQKARKHTKNVARTWKCHFWVMESRKKDILSAESLKQTPYSRPSKVLYQNWTCTWNRTWIPSPSFSFCDNKCDLVVNMMNFTAFYRSSQAGLFLCFRSNLHILERIAQPSIFQPSSIFYIL